MTMTSRIPDLFGYIGPDHRFYRQLEEWRAMIAAHAEFTSLLGRMERAEPTIIHTEIKANIVGGSWAIERFYWSFQYWDVAKGHQFHGLTLNYSARTGESEWASFPHDSYLQTAKEFFMLQAQNNALHCQVLRYVPLRRLTFRVTPIVSDGALMIGKFKRRSRYVKAYELIGYVADAVAQADVSFHVAAPLGIDHERCLYFQEAKAGKNLISLLDGYTTVKLLRQVGVIHQELHTLDIPEAPRWEFDTLFVDLQAAINWITVCQPAYAQFLDDIRVLLVQTMPSSDPAHYVVCHGDFVCSQLLCAGDAWSVTDFDLCHYGDRYHDMAILLTSLNYDVPLFQQDHQLCEQAAHAYLQGYQAQARHALDERRLTWFRIVTELIYLALMLKKDWYSPAIFTQALMRIDNLRQYLVTTSR